MNILPKYYLVVRMKRQSLVLRRYLTFFPRYFVKRAILLIVIMIKYLTSKI